MFVTLRTYILESRYLIRAVVRFTRMVMRNLFLKCPLCTMDVSNQSEVLDIVVLSKSSTDEPIEIDLYSLLKSERQTSLVNQEQSSPQQ